MVQDVEKSLAFCHELPYEEGRPVFEHGSGVRLTDTTGKTYIDGLSGIFVVSFGYSCAPIVEAVQRQLSKLPFSPPLHGLNPSAIELGESLAALAGAPFNCVKLVNGGSESIEAALRITRLYHRSNGHHQKTKILSHFNGYHGTTYGAMSATHRPDLNVFGPRLPGFLGIWPPNCEALPFGSDPIQCAELCTAMVERLIQSEGPDTIGAILVEPIIHLIGMFMPPREYFVRLREICDRYDILLIFDEIVTGFGRTGEVFAAKTIGVTPDMICMGKGVSGGYAPLAAVLMSEKVSRILRDTKKGIASLAPSHTYAGNPVSAAAGLAATKLLGAEGMLPQVRASGSFVESRLKEAFGNRATIRGVGLLWGVKFEPPSGMSKSDFLASRLGDHVVRSCIKNGVIVRGEADWIVIAPPYIASKEEINLIIGAVQESVDSFFRNGVTV